MSHIGVPIATVYWKRDRIWFSLCSFAVCGAVTCFMLLVSWHLVKGSDTTLCCIEAVWCVASCCAVLPAGCLCRAAYSVWAHKPLLSQLVFPDFVLCCARELAGPSSLSGSTVLNIEVRNNPFLKKLFKSFLKAQSRLTMAEHPRIAYGYSDTCTAHIAYWQ